jgi:phosphoglycolate phosphatase-like HAD superfamily hydrolase
MKTVKKIIGFDMDGVIIDLSVSKIILAKQSGFELTPEQTPSEIIRTLLPLQIMQKLQYLLYDHPEISLDHPLMPGAETAIREIKNSGLSYYLISRRKDSEIAKALLKKRGLWPLYFNESNSFFVENPEDKNIKALELGVTHYLDDEIKILEKLSSVNNRFLFDQFSVRQEADFYTRVNSWPAALKHLI